LTRATARVILRVTKVSPRSAVCTDTLTREYWIAAMVSTDYGCSSFPILTLGAVVRVWIGSRIPDHIRRY
jgi:hypothetical protein